MRSPPSGRRWPSASPPCGRPRPARCPPRCSTSRSAPPSPACTSCAPSTGRRCGRTRRSRSGPCPGGRARGRAGSRSPAPSPRRRRGRAAGSSSSAAASRCPAWSPPARARRCSPRTGAPTRSSSRHITSPSTASPATPRAADWAEHGDALAARGPFDAVLAADVFYTRANVGVALRLLPRLLVPGGVVRLADPGRAGARDFLAGARGRFALSVAHDGDVALHTLRLR